MVDRNSEWKMRSPTVGMSTEDLLRNAYAKEFARMKLGEQMRKAYLGSFAATSPFAGGGAGGAMPQAARQNATQGTYEVGAAEDALGGFNTQMEFGDRMLQMMRQTWEAQQPGMGDYLKQAALTIGPRLLGL